MNIKRRAKKSALCQTDKQIEAAFPKFQTTNASWMTNHISLWKGTSGNKNHINSLMNILRQKVLK
jgi:hypothetical protein